MALGAIDEAESSLVPPGLPGGAISEVLPGEGAPVARPREAGGPLPATAPVRTAPGDEPLVDLTVPGEPLLRVVDLGVRFGRDASAVDAVRGVSFDVARGETVALVGESGSGKSVTALSILRLLPYPQASHPSGRIAFDGENLLDASGEVLRRVRGGRVGMVFQEPMTS
ncbi:MAG: ATP-binding cassette domain-containing protein, partial [Alphaproteobacteria bacterium]